MSGKAVYEVEITGTGKAVTALQEVEKTLAMGGTEAAGKFGNALKSVSRDIDVIGGDLTAKVAKGMSDVLGIVEAVGTGGILGPIAVVSAAVGGIVTLVGQWRAEEERVTKAAETAGKAHTQALQDATAWADKFASAAIAGRAAITMQSLNLQTATIAARGLVDAQLIGEEGILRARAKTALHTERDVTRHLELTREAEEIKARRAEFNAQTAVLVAKRESEGQVFAHKAGLEAEAAASQEASDKILKKRAEAAAAEKARVEKEQAESYARTKAASEAERAEWEKRDRARSAALENEWQEMQKGKEKATQDEAAASQARSDAMEKEWQAMRKLTEENEKLGAATQARQQKQNQADAMLLYSAVVNESYAASVMVVSAAMGPLNAQLQKFGTINRENWRDLLLFTEDSKAAFAAQVQAALWSLAQQAGSKATMEAGEAVKETALAFGAYAIHDYPGAGLHAASAATHTVAAQVYAGIAGTSAGASVGIGMARGEGGLVGLTKEEREAKDREIGTRTAGDSAGGPVAGVGRSERAGPVVVNFVYEAGAINAQNRDAAAATVASATRHARRDGFRRREMGG